MELTNNDDPALSVPFLGFYGDWTKAPIFEDADIYNGLDTKMYATNVAGVYAMMYVVKLGMYPFVVPEGYDTPSTSADGRARLHAAVRGQRFVRFVPQLRCK